MRTPACPAAPTSNTHEEHATDIDELEQVLAAVGFTVETADAGMPEGVRAWVVSRSPQVALVLLQPRHDGHEVTIAPVDDAPATLGPVCLYFEPPATAAQALQALLARNGIDRLPAHDPDACLEQAHELLLAAPLAEVAGLDRADLAVAELDGVGPWELLPVHVRRLAGPQAAARLVERAVMLHPHVGLARDAMAAHAGPTGAVTADGVDLAVLSASVSGHASNRWMADACSWLGSRHALAALTAAGAAGR